MLRRWLGGVGIVGGVFTVGRWRFVRTGTPDAYPYTDTYTDPAGNKYTRTATGWQLADWSFGQAEEVPADAEPGDIVQTPSGDIFEVMADGNMTARPDLGRFYNPESAASALAVPTDTLPGGSHPSDMQGFTQTSPLGAFEQTSPLGVHRARSSSDNSFGYAAA